MGDLLDEHLNDCEDDCNEDGEGKDNKGRPVLTEAEKKQIRDEIKEAMIAAAQSAGAGRVPAGIARMISDLTEPKMDWRQLLRMNIQSIFKSNFSFTRPNRKSQHCGAVLPGMMNEETIDVSICIDMSGSISNKQAQAFLGEISGMMEAFDGYKVHIFCFDTDTYNPQDFTSENMDSIHTYEPQGGGGTDFDVIFSYLKEAGNVPKRLIVFTDGYPCGSWGDADYCDTTWIIHGDPDPHPPFGQFALYDEK